MIDNHFLQMIDAAQLQKSAPNAEAPAKTRPDAFQSPGLYLTQKELQMILGAGLGENEDSQVFSVGG